MEKRKIKIEIEYDGSAYHGWQRQRGLATIQQTIEDALSIIAKEKVIIHGASRTDSGVHALNQVAHFITSTPLKNDVLHRAVNANLPYDIAITKLKTAPQKFHAQMDAKSKTYRYSVENRNIPSPMHRNRCWWVPKPLNLTLMKKGATYITGTHDFRAFETSGDRRKSAKRTIYSCEVTRDGDIITITIHGNGFLKQMIRAIVGTLIMVGEEKYTPECINDILRSQDRRQAGKNAPAKGLCLVKVRYDSPGGHTLSP